MIITCSLETVTKSRVQFPDEEYYPKKACTMLLPAVGLPLDFVCLFPAHVQRAPLLPAHAARCIASTMYMASIRRCGSYTWADALQWRVPDDYFWKQVPTHFPATSIRPLPAGKPGEISKGSGL
jgi:hypothetical protein